MKAGGTWQATKSRSLGESPRGSHLAVLSPDGVPGTRPVIIYHIRSSGKSHTRFIRKAKTKVLKAASHDGTNSHVEKGANLCHTVHAAK